MKDNQITICIVRHDEDCTMIIETLLANTNKTLFDILIIDNGNNDELHLENKLKTKYKQKYKRIKCNDTRLSASRKLGAKLCKTEYIWFIDADDDIILDNMLSYKLNSLDFCLFTKVLIVEPFRAKITQSHGSLWGAIWNSKFIYENIILVNNIVYEDVYTWANILLNKHNFNYIIDSDVLLYKYFKLNDKSMSKSQITPETKQFLLANKQKLLKLRTSFFKYAFEGVLEDTMEILYDTINSVHFLDINKINVG